jgi:hypothetical protein
VDKSFLALCVVSYYSEGSVPRVIQDAKLAWYTGGSTTAGGSGGGVCGVRPNRRPSFSFDVLATMFQAKIFTISTCVRDCIKRHYTREQIYISQIARQCCEHLRQQG